MADIDRLLGRSIAEQRARVGLSRAELAGTLGVSEHAIARLEDGRRRAPASQLFAIADALDIPLESFFPATAGHTDPPRPTALPPGGEFDDARHIIEHYNALSAQSRAASFAFLVALQHDARNSYDQ
jgi:transcriptional regulator with XRE-family HTH domain